MSLYGSLFSGVSGLNAFSQALGTISDNISNVNTVGYKETVAAFSTLVTSQTTNNSYAPGGVLFNSNALIDKQGLLQSSTSATDLAVSGQGMFVVNSVAIPTSSDPFLYTRAGSFTPDQNGDLKNSAGFYLQGWVTDSAGVPTATNTSVLSSLNTVNVSGASGSATATTTISLGANLPATDLNAATHITNAQVFDSLGVAHDLAFTWTKSSTNQWNLDVQTPAGANLVTVDDSIGAVYAAMGRLDIPTVPTDGQIITIKDGSEGTLTFEFDTNASVTGSNIRVDVAASTTGTQAVAALLAAFQDYTGQYTAATAVTNNATISSSDLGTFVTPTLVGATQLVTASANTILAGLTNSNNELVVPITITGTGAEIRLGALVGVKYQLNAAGITGANTNSDDLVGAAANSTIKIYIDDGGTDVLVGTLTLPSAPTLGASAADGAAGDLTLGAFTRTNDTRLTQGTGSDSTALLFTQSATGAATVINPTSATAIIQSSKGSFTVPATAAGTPAITFDGNGVPIAFKAANVEINGYSSGAIDSNMALSLGTVGLSDGMTQFAGDYNVLFINQNGVQFGTFSGVSISDKGVVTALFDNGETLPIYQVPLVTFTNFNGLVAKTGNVYVGSNESGTPVLRIAKSGSTGTIAAGALENSTVDIGTEFTNMIITQRAYSANTRIITTADEMLDELIRIKR